MKFKIQLVVFLYFIVSTAYAEEVAPTDCNNNEILISLVDYSFCVAKKTLHSANVIGGSNTTISIAEGGFEYSFSRIPISLALLNIPKKFNMSVNQFFIFLIDLDHKDNGFPSIRSAFEINKDSLASKYALNKINAVYVINRLSSINSIYIYNNEDQYIYLVKGAFDKPFALKFLSRIYKKNNI